MPLRLTYASSTAPLLEDILGPLIRRHIDFKRRDSFRIVVPDPESRKDLDHFFISRDELGGVLIGKSLLTLASFAQALLLRHPDPLPLAPTPLQRKCLKLAMRKVAPDRELDVPATQRCLRELHELSRLHSLRTSNRTCPGWKLLKSYENLLQTLGSSWTSERLFEAAWRVVSQNPPPDLELVEDFFFLGFRLPEPTLLDGLQALLASHPKMRVHLFLPSRDKVMDSQGHLEPWLDRLESLAQGPFEEIALDLPKIELLPFLTPAHEAFHLFEKVSPHLESHRVLPVGFSPVEPILVSQFEAFLAPRGLAGGLQSGASQIATRLFQALETRRDGATPVLFGEILAVWEPVFLELQAALAGNADLDSLRLLEGFRQRVQEWTRAEALEKEARPWSRWIEDLKNDFLELRLASGSSLAQRLPLRRLDRAGLAPVPHLWVAGFNEGYCPVPEGPRFFEEESEDFLRRHETRLALDQALRLATDRACLTWAQFSNSGRSLRPSPFLADFDLQGLQDNPEALSLPVLNGHRYFSENVAREGRRHSDPIPGLDAGDLSSLGLEGEILEKLLRHPLRATYLDDYVKCPWRFFARWQLKLEEKPEEELEMAPTRRGSFLHRLLEETFKSLLKDFFAAGNFPSRSEAEIGLAQIFSRLQEEILALKLPVPPVLLRDQLNRLHETALRLLNEEQRTWSEAPQKLIPRHFEWKFVFHHPQASIPISGAIDRIDVSAGQGHYLLIDYKSSRGGELAKSLRDGKSLQLWIYLQAVKHLLYPKAEALGALFWDLKELEKNQGMARREPFRPFTAEKISGNSKSFMKDEDFSELDARLNAVLHETLARILRGDYGLAPAECLGDFCEFREVCRYEDKPRR